MLVALVAVESYCSLHPVGAIEKNALVAAMPREVFSCREKGSRDAEAAVRPANIHSFDLSSIARAHFAQRDASGQICAHPGQPESRGWTEIFAAKFPWCFTCNNIQ